MFLSLILIQIAEVSLGLNYSPERINAPQGSALLAFAFTAPWFTNTVLFAQSFYLRRPRRRKLMYKWLGKYIKFFQPWGQIEPA